MTEKKKSLLQFSIYVGSLLIFSAFGFIFEKSIMTQHHITGKNTHNHTIKRKTYAPAALLIESDASGFDNISEMDLKITYRPVMKMEKVEFFLDLPESIKLVRGNKSFLIEEAEAYKDYIINIRIKSTTEFPQNEQIFLRTESLSGGVRLGQVAVFHTQEHQMIREAQRDVFERTQAYRKTKAKN